MKYSKEEKRRRSELFLRKADRFLGWLRTFGGQMKQFGTSGDLDNFERVLHSSLALIASIHDALADSAKLAGKSQWADRLKDLRDTDPLLFYLWKARNVDIHDVLTTRSEGTEAMAEVVDEAKLQPLLDSFEGLTLDNVVERLMCHLFHAENGAEVGLKIRDGYRPPQEDLDAVGLKLHFALSSFTFQQFTINQGDRCVVTPPLKHGSEQIIPSAFTCVQQAYLFYARQLVALRKEIGAQPSTPLAPQGAHG